MDKQRPEVRVFKCRTWDEFRSKLRIVEGRVAGNRIYRGHARLEWKLSSMFERWLSGSKGNNPARNVRDGFSSPKAFEQYRDGYLERFKDLATGLPGVETHLLAEDDWWVLGRHYGLITPLLDWTRSPYVAAFFAFLDFAEEHNKGFKDGTINIRREGIIFEVGTVSIWCLALWDDLEKAPDFRIIWPRLNFSFHTQRLRAQKSAFTRLENGVHLDIESYLVSRGIGHFLERFEIPGQEFGKALGDLELMNITPASLFPDLGGAAALANLWTSLAALRGTGIVR